MTIGREATGVQRPHAAWALAGLVLVPLLIGAPALAAQIDITNCLSETVTICSYEKIGVGWNENHVLHENETKHYTCNANCMFWLIEGNRQNHCPSYKVLGISEEGAGINHSWGKGHYLLVGTQKDKSGDYSSSNLQEGSSCPSGG